MSEKKTKWNLTHAQAMLVYMIAVISLFLFGLRLYGFLANTNDLKDTQFFGSKMLGIILIITMIIFHRNSVLKLNWKGLGNGGSPETLKKSLLYGAGIAVIVALVLLGCRFYLNTKNPANAEVPWFGLYLNMNLRWFYPLNMPFQELFIHSFVQDNVARAFDRKNRHLIIFLQAIFFFILHLQYPIYYSLGACTLCLITGYLYDKYPTIWGPFLIHFAVGFLPRSFGIFAIIE